MTFGSRILGVIARQATLDASEGPGGNDLRATGFAYPVGTAERGIEPGNEMFVSGDKLCVRLRTTTVVDEIRVITDGDPYARPRGATPSRHSLVPAYAPCTSGNTTHGPALSYPSCNPPSQSSPNLTVGTPDVNQAGPNFTGLVLLRAISGAGADLKITVSTTDIRCQTGVSPCGPSNTAGGADYTGEVQETTEVRITDRFNGSSSSDAATVTDFSFPVTVSCASTSSTSVGSTCSVDTSVNALQPGAITEGKRTIWELGQVQVYDGGSDGVVSTADNTLFATQGVFVP